MNGLFLSFFLFTGEPGQHLVLDRQRYATLAECEAAGSQTVEVSKAGFRTDWPSGGQRTFHCMGSLLPPGFNQTNGKDNG